MKNKSETIWILTSEGLVEGGEDLDLFGQVEIALPPQIEIDGRAINLEDGTWEWLPCTTEKKGSFQVEAIWKEIIVEVFEDFETSDRSLMKYALNNRAFYEVQMVSRKVELVWGRHQFEGDSLEVAQNRLKKASGGKYASVTAIIDGEEISINRYTPSIDRDLSTMQLLTVDGKALDSFAEAERFVMEAKLRGVWIVDNWGRNDQKTNIGSPSGTWSTGSTYTWSKW